MSTLGDPISDLAVMLVYWTDAGDTLRSAVPVAQHITDQPGFWTRAELVARYADHSGRSLDHLDFCAALACFKLAVIMESILARSLQGQQLGTGASEVDAMRKSTEALTVLGLRVLDEGAIVGLGS
jgi:aminoglycoside phosphotransferase (APT) family kinase protein